MLLQLLDVGCMHLLSAGCPGLVSGLPPAPHAASLPTCSCMTRPPLQGGVKAFLSCLRQHAPLVRSADDPNTYLVNDTGDPLQRSLW